MKEIIQQFNKTLKRLFHLDTSYFMTTSFLGFLQQLIGVSSGLFISYLFGHFTSKTVFGEYNLVLSISGMLLFFSLPGLDQPLTKSVSLGYDASLIQTTNLKLRSSLLGVPVVVAFALYYSYRGFPSVAAALIILAAAFPFLNSFSTYPAYLTGKRKFFSLSAYAVLASLFFLLITAAGVFLLPTTVGLISAYLIATIIPAFFTCLRCIRQIPKNARKDQKLPRYGVFLSLLSVLPWISGNIGSIILASLVGPEALAIYAVASRFLTAVQKNFTVFYKPVTAKLASQSQYEHWQTIRLHGFKLLCIGFLLAFALWVTTPVLIQFFFTRQYDEAVYFGQLLSLALIPLPFAWVLSDMIIYEKRKKPQVFISVVPPLTKIFLYFILIPRFGLLGLVLITLLERYTDPLVPFISLVLAHKKG